jgi:hypothetical protein
VNLPLTAAIVLVTVVASVGLFLLVRRHSPAGGFFNDGDRAAGVFGVLATGFAVLLGFIVYLAFTTYDSARSGARAEAIVVLQQYETAQLFPQPASAELSGALLCYGRAVIAQEWPALRGGKADFANPWGVPMFRIVTSTNPRTPAQQAAFSKWLDQTSQREQARLDRVQAGEGVIPAPLWIILFVTGGLVAVYAFLFADPEEHWLPQAVIAGTIAAMLAVSLLVIRFLDNPYTRGTGSLQPTQMRTVLAELDKASKSLGIRVHPPCDAAGRALAHP